MLLLLNIDFYVFLKIPSVLYVPFEVPQQSNNSKTGAGNTHITHILTTSIVRTLRGGPAVEGLFDTWLKQTICRRQEISQ